MLSLSIKVDTIKLYLRTAAKLLARRNMIDPSIDLLIKR